MKTEAHYPLTRTFLVIAVGLTALTGRGLGQSAISPEQAEFFETKIRPVLVDSCYECHSTEAGKKKGGLSLDTRFALRDGGNSGPGVVPGKLEESWIWLAVSHAEPDYEMPPKNELPDYVIEDFKTWIEMGAPDPREGEKAVDSKIDIEAGKQFWSFQRPRRETPPEAKDQEWAKTGIDRFIYAKLESQNLEPAKPADAHAILRRLCFDLIGMPPTLAFTEQFHRAWKESPNEAIQTTVDRLLLSRQFGERWGRHWLDVARYAESNGKGANQSFPNAWRFRDYVIDSFNEDKPFDRLILEQLAGDLIPTESDKARQENLIATGFLAIGPKDLREKSSRQFTMEMIDEQINTTSTAFLGLTVSCARCHDHKTDPIPTLDYYAIAGVFLSSNTHYGTDGIGGRFNQGDLIQLPLAGETGESFTASDIAKMQAELVEVKDTLRVFHGEKRARMQMAAEDKVEDNGKRGSAKKFRARESQLEEKLGSLTGAGSVKSYAMGMADKEQPVDTHVLVRGEIDSPAQVVPRGFLQVLDHSPAAISENASGRLEMARWIASNRNPLTARVFVNRVWEKLFGQGLVTSVDNFGTTGQAPSHPELLDHLAICFMESGWSLKKLIRSIVLTRTYQLSSEFNSPNYRKDPDNKFLWRAAPRRLDAESFRDTILAASGQLKLERPFRSPVAEHGLEELGRKGSPDVLTNFPPYRSVYLPPIRDKMPEFIETFDGADPNTVTGRREVSNGAEQSLMLMNSPFITGQSSHFANLLREDADQIGDQVRLAFSRAFGRPPTSGEYDSAIRFYRVFMASLKKDLDEEEAGKEFLKRFCQGLLCSAEIRYLR